MYTDGDVRYVELLSVEASIAMRNAGLFEEKNQRVREFTALNDLVGDTDPRFKDALKRGHIVSGISAPTVYKDPVIGVLSVVGRSQPSR